LVNVSIHAAIIDVTLWQNTLSCSFDW